MKTKTDISIHTRYLVGTSTSTSASTYQVWLSRFSFLREEAMQRSAPVTFVCVPTTLRLPISLVPVLFFFLSDREVEMGRAE